MINNVKKRGHIRLLDALKSKRRYLDRLIDCVITLIAIAFVFSLFYPVMEAIVEMLTPQ